jgi:hypothetical protein
MNTFGKKLITWARFGALAVTFAMPVAALASDNSIYIQQSGDNATVTMTQDGVGNVVRGIQGSGTGNTTPATIIGNSNQVTVNQVGISNTLNLGLNTTVSEGISSGNRFSYAITGNNSTATIDSNANGQNQSSSNVIGVTQTGNNSGANVNVLGAVNSVTATTTGGNNNTVVSTVNGNSNTQTINVTGGGNNAVTVNQGVGGSAASAPAMIATNSNGSATLTVTGASNTATVVQTGSANTTVLALDGSSNIANIIQAATSGNTTVNVVSAGNGNRFTINSNAH